MSAAVSWIPTGFDLRKRGPAATVQDGRSVGLQALGIAVNALRGSQVTLDGMELVGQVPSRLVGQFTDYLETHNKELWYFQCAELRSAQIGPVLRAQRAGDLLLNRPATMAEA